ncbi:MAG: DUF3027 domain-containing protein [Actinomycetota bacterium]|nr:DUF3027 domain-containing protein [Actinomycetota bacterium]
MSSHPAPTDLIENAAGDPDAPNGRGVPDRPSQVTDGNSAEQSDTAGSRVAVVVLLDDVAVGVARTAAVAEAGSGDQVGEFLVAIAEDDIAVAATFAAEQAGYGGWQWSVTLALLGETPPTVSEVVLLPGENALLAPVWIPWDRRIRPGDVGVGDLLPPVEDDPRLAPTYLQSDDPAVEEVAHELGIGRITVLSREGRVDFAERLHDGPFGPLAEMALSAPAPCFTCAFYLPLAGSLGRLTGACSNEYSPADGRVVDAGYGCGAHSETVLNMPARSAAADSVIDELSLEVHRRPVGSARSARTGGELVEAAEPAPADLDPDEMFVADSEPADGVGADLEPADIQAADLEPADIDLQDEG